MTDLYLNGITGCFLENRLKGSKNGQGPDGLDAVVIHATDDGTLDLGVSVGRGERNRPKRLLAGHFSNYGS